MRFVGVVVGTFDAPIVAVRVPVRGRVAVGCPFVGCLVVAAVAAVEAAKNFVAMDRAG